MFLINPRSIVKFASCKNIVSQYLFTKKLNFSFSIWKKTKNVQHDVTTQNKQTKKEFLKDLKNKDTIMEQKQNVVVEPIKQKDNSNFLSSKKKIQKSRIKVRQRFRSYQKFLFQSKFHQQGFNFQKQIQTVQKLDESLIKKSDKQQLIGAIVQISREREKIWEQNMSKETIYEQLLELSHKSKKNLKIHNYVLLYEKVSQSVEKILRKCKQSGNLFSQAHYIMLNLISVFNLLEFYTYYLFKLLHIKDKHKLDKITVQQAKFCRFVVQKLPQIQFQFVNNKMSYDLQKYVQEFFQKKAQIILQKGKHQQQSNQKLLPDHQFKIFEEQITFLMNLEKIFKNTHLTFGKHNFYANFVKKNIHLVNNPPQIVQSFLKQRTQKIVELFYLSTQNLYLDRQIINEFENYLQFISEKYNPNIYVSEHVSRLVFQIYEKIGEIPDVVYDAFVADYIYNRFSQSEYNLVQCVKFYVFSQCDDKLFLQGLFNKLQNLINSKQFSANKKSKHLLHFLFHFMCIKYPNIANNYVSKKILGYCTTHTPKNHFILAEIMKSVKKTNKSHHRNSQTSIFTSFCIERESRRIEDNKKSQLSTLQERMFKECLQKVITRLNKDPDQLFYYEIKERFSFCSFQLDFIVLKWDSQKKQKLFSYLDAECVGLQYSYDKNESQNEVQTAKQMQSMKLVQYEKGLELIRKKKVRQSILRHYGWKILYVPNKFLYQKNMTRQRFQQKLQQAILTKLSL